MTDQTHSGGCLCGAIRYHVTGPLRPIVACHCSQCRKSSGNHVAASAAMRADLRIEGKPRWYASSADARRGFCPDCGGNLFWDGGGDRVSIMAGTLDGPTGLSVAGHIHCADKADWLRIADGLPQYAGDDDGALVGWSA